MPRGDGVEFIGKLRAAFPEAMVIAVSGKGPELLAAAKSTGAFLTLSKPIDPNELIWAITQAVPRGGEAGEAG